VNIGGISRKTVAIYGTINFGAINLLLPNTEQFYGAIIWSHLMAPFYGMCVPGITKYCFGTAPANETVIKVIQRSRCYNVIVVFSE